MKFQPWLSFAKAIVESGAYTGRSGSRRATASAAGFSWELFAGHVSHRALFLPVAANRNAHSAEERAGLLAVCD